MSLQGRASGGGRLLSISRWLPAASQCGGRGEPPAPDLFCPRSLEFLKLLGFRVVCWNWVHEEGNAVLWNVVQGDLWKARSHSPRATCAKSGTAASLTDNMLSF